MTKRTVSKKRRGPNVLKNEIAVLDAESADVLKAVRRLR